MSDTALIIAGTRRRVVKSSVKVDHAASGPGSHLKASLYIPGATWRPVVGQEIAFWSDASTIGSARTFNGSSTVLSRAFADGTTNNWTIGAWAKAVSSGVQRFIWIVGDASDGFGVYVTSANYWQGVLSGVITVGGTAAPMVENAWTHVCLRRSAGTTQLFVNGVAVGSTTASAPNAPNGFMSVGARRNAGNTAFEQFFDGAIAHAFYATSALTDAQIAAIAAGGPAGTGRAVDAVITGTYWYYPIRGSASPEPDTASGTPLTVTGATQTLDGPLVVASGADMHFAGVIEDADEGGVLNEPVSNIMVDVVASDFNTYGARIHQISELPSDTVAGRMATVVSAVPLFTSLSIAADQPTGPTLIARAASNQKMTLAIRAIEEEAGYVSRISEFKEWSIRPPSAVAAPFDINTGSPGHGVIGDVRVRYRVVGGYCNFLRVFFGSGTRARTDLFTGDGVAATFYLSAVVDRIDAGTVLVNGSTSQTLSVNTSGGQWELDTTTRTLTRVAGALPNGHTVAIEFTGRYPEEVTTQIDAAGLAAYGLYGDVLELPTEFDPDRANAAGVAKFAAVSKLPAVATYATYRPGLRVGQVQHITVPHRDLDADCVITGVSLVWDGASIRYQVTASSDGVPPDWRSVWQSMAS